MPSPRSAPSPLRSEVRNWKAAPRFACVVLLLAGFIAMARGQSALDGFDPYANGIVRAVLVQPDGKVLIGGDFTSVAPNGGAPVTRNRIARFNPDGTLDSAFDPNADASVYAIALQADGKVIAGGFFWYVGGQPRSNVARLDALTGSPDSFNFNAQTSGDLVRVIAVQPDGKVLVGGSFAAIGGQLRNNMARFDPTTGQCDSFNPNANGEVRSITVQADGKILAGGGFTTIGGQIRNHIARLDATNALADSFDPKANDSVLTIATQADGKVLAGGLFTTIGGEERHRIARLSASTGAADSFDPEANNTVYAVVVQLDGKILVAGNFDTSVGQITIGGQTRNYLARLDAATGLPDTFNPNPGDAIRSIALQPDEKILIGGDFNTVAPNGGAPVTRNHIARLEADGRLDRTLNLDLVSSDYIGAIAVQPDGKTVISGDFFSVLGEARNYIARINTDGTLDTSFNPNPDRSVSSLVLQNDGKILVSGSFSNIGGQARRGIARLDAASGAADSFNANANGIIGPIAIQADGKILAAGEFTTIGGQMRRFIARLDPVTGAADAFNPGADNSIYAIGVQPDGKILVGGLFQVIGGQSRSGLARLAPATATADDFAPQGFAISTIALQSDGKVLVGGSFTQIGGRARFRIARLDGNTGLADAFDPSPSGGLFGPRVTVIRVQSDGKVLVGGEFSAIGGQPRKNLARLEGTSGLADAFDPNPNLAVSSIALGKDGKVFVGGGFTTVGGQSRNRFARLANDTAAITQLTATRDAITLVRDGAAPQLSRITFEQSRDNGATFTVLGDAAPSLPLAARDEIHSKDPGRRSPQTSTYSLGGLNLPTGNNILLRARGRQTTDGVRSEIVEDKVRNVFFPGAVGIVSRKTHGGAGNFDVPLPLTGEPGVECRASGGAHTLVVTFSTSVVSGNASVTTGSGSISGSPFFNGNTMTVNLAGVADAQKIIVTLSSVTDSFNQVLPDTAVSMNLLAGDTNGNKTVNGTDVSQTKAQASLPVTSANFRQDVTVNGLINASDVSFVKSRVGQSVP